MTVHIKWLLIEKWQQSTDPEKQENAHTETVTFLIVLQ